MNVLLVVDPQNDFISGSLAVAGADAKMDRLVSWAEEHLAEIDAIVVTLDQHPHNHCSFASVGGIWPAHCIKYSYGAAIYTPVMHFLDACHTAHKPLLYIEKATSPDKDAYSAFETEIPEILLQADRIWVAGIAGDYCVKESIKDLSRNIDAHRIVAIKEAIAYIHPQE